MRVILVIAAAISCVFGVPSGHKPLEWIDCSDDPNNTAITINHFDFNPIPLKLPGDMYVTLNLTVNRQIAELYSDVELTRISFFGVEAPVPCINNVGSCKGISACDLLAQTQSGEIPVSEGIGQQMNTILVSTLGKDAKCPIDPRTVSVVNQKFTVDKIPSALAYLASGTYRIKLSIYEDKESAQNVGCMQFTTTFKSSNGFFYS